MLRLPFGRRSLFHAFVPFAAFRSGSLVIAGRRTTLITQYHRHSVFLQLAHYYHQYIWQLARRCVDVDQY